MLKELKAFIMRGNLLDLAVAVIIAGAFGAVVTSFTNDIIMPPLGMLLGGVDFSDLALTLKAAELGPDGAVTAEAVQLRYGMFIQTVVDFLIIATVIFMVVKVYNRALESAKKKEEEAPAAPAGPTTEQLLAEIRDLLKKN
ncbi:MAG: large-conductance mechanosensitive channel protein MscL [Saprospiraceae bacterium]|jgi:large conductance mechanosensitive channel|nr:large-conductance mechanosensitive channel protein MscL [Saprospiraceae bacterium]